MHQFKYKNNKEQKIIELDSDSIDAKTNTALVQSVIETLK